MQPHPFGHNKVLRPFDGRFQIKQSCYLWLWRLGLACAKIPSRLNPAKGHCYMYA